MKEKDRDGKNVTMAGQAHKSGNREELLSQAMNNGRLR